MPLVACETQYRIFMQERDGGRTWVSTAYVDPLGIAAYSWAGDRKRARLFESATIAISVAEAIERAIAAYRAARFETGRAVKLKVVPATGGHPKAR